MSRERGTSRYENPEAVFPGIMVSYDQLLSTLDPEALFGNTHPLEVDLGCGMGRFLRARASKFPDVNYLGVDRLYARMHKLASHVQADGLTNVRLLRVEGSYVIERMLPAHAVTTCYIFFPDPWPKKRHHRRRLVNDAFLTALHSRMKPGGVVHFASDHLPYYEAVKECFAPRADYVAVDPFLPTEDERTDFELIFKDQDKPTGRCSYRAISPAGAA
jgi:tRNA (guanine-N7-)-methyltransferase